MVDRVRGLQSRIAALDRRIARQTAIQIRSQPIRADAQEIVDFYFRTTREPIRTSGAQSDPLDTCDTHMQELLEATHHSTTATAYRGILRALRSALDALETASLLVQSSVGARTAVDPTDAKILATLKKLAPSAAASYEQALLDLQTAERLSWRGPATDLREALRECLDCLAPDADVKSQPGFKLEPETKGPTMKQKVRFILKKRGLSASLAQTPESAADAVEEAVGAFVRSVYTRSSVSTHTPTDKREVIRVRDWVRGTLCELLEIQ